MAAERVQPANLYGQLKITCIKAKLTIDLETFGKQDPYVKLRWNNMEEKEAFKSKPHDGAGKNPEWNVPMILPKLEGNERSLVLEIWDAEAIKDVFICGSEIPLKDLFAQEPNPKWHAVYRKAGLVFKEDKTVGDILLQTEFDGECKA